MLEILLSNDDGIDSPGLAALEQALGVLGRVWVVAPDGERSASSRSITLDRPLRVRQHAPRRFAVDGTPADCVLLACRSLLPQVPQLVVAGVNLGYNIGEDLDYSGTVGAAAEGAQQRARLAVAVSTVSSADQQLLLRAAGFAASLIGKLLEHLPPERTYLNINVPPDCNGQIRWTRQGNPLPRGTVIIGSDPRGKKYYWIAERPDEKEPPPDTDRGALAQGNISVSLLTLARDFPGRWQAPAL